MPTFKSEFQDLAAELIDDEFADFRRSLTFIVTTAGGYDPILEQVIGGTTTNYNYQAIPTKINLFEWQRNAVGSGGSDIQVSDFAVTYTVIDNFRPPASATCTYSGKLCQVVDATFDAADAAVKLILRAL